VTRCFVIILSSAVSRFTELHLLIATRFACELYYACMGNSLNLLKIDCITSWAYRGYFVKKAVKQNQQQQQ